MCDAPTRLQMFDISYNRPGSNEIFVNCTTDTAASVLI